MKSVALNLDGKRFGRLLVIARGEKPKGVASTKAYWLCKCDCGAIKTIVGSSLRNGETVSCGCYGIEQRRKSVFKGVGHGARHALFLDYRYTAKIRKLEFCLDEPHFILLTSSNCFYCGTVPKMVNVNKNCIGTYTYNGVDRIDSSKGYVKGNVVPCCWNCNRAKSTLSTDEFLSMVVSIYKNMHLDDLSINAIKKRII